MHLAALKTTSDMTRAAGQARMKGVCRAISNQWSSLDTQKLRKEIGKTMSSQKLNTFS